MAVLVVRKYAADHFSYFVAEISVRIRLKALFSADVDVV